MPRHFSKGGLERLALETLFPGGVLARHFAGDGWVVRRVGKTVVILLSDSAIRPAAASDPMLSDQYLTLMSCLFFRSAATPSGVTRVWRTLSLDRLGN